MTNYLKGTFLVALSAFIYGLAPWAIMFVISNGGNELSCCFFRCLFSLPVGYLLLLRLPKGERSLNCGELKKIIILALALGSTMMMLIGSYGLVGTSVATTLHYSYPAFTLLGCAIFCQERIRPIPIVCVALTLVGVALCYSPGRIDNLLGTLMAFLSGASFAFYMIYLDKSGLSQQMPTLKYTVYLHTFIAIFVGIVALLAGKIPVTMPLKAWGMQMLISLVIVFGAAALLPMGIRHIGPQRASIISTFEPLTAILMGLLVLGEPYTTKTIIGMILILIAVITLTLVDHKKQDDTLADSAQTAALEQNS